MKRTRKPLVSGLTIIRNGVRLNYPFIEAIRSVLPICDEVIHEKDLPHLRQLMETYADNESVEAMLVERKRLLESSIYSRFGLPGLSRNRFKLIGSLLEKERPSLGALGGTLNL